MPGRDAAPAPTAPQAAWPRRAGLLTVAVAVLAFACALAKVTSYDTWVHLSVGRWIAAEGRVPRANLISHTQPDRPTIEHRWLFQVGLWGLWRLGGPGAATVVKAALAGAAFALVLATARRKGAEIFVAAVFAVLAACAARFRLTLRPQVVAFLLFAAYLLVLERWRRGERWGILALLPLQVLWANVHGSAILGIGLGLGYAGAESLRWALRRATRDVEPGPRGIAALAGLWAVAGALAALTLVNPHGWRVLTLPFLHAETQKLSGLKELLRDRSSLRWADLAGRHACFAALAGLGLASLAGSVRRKDVTEAGLLLGLLAAAVHSERFIGLFAVGGAPICARNLSPALRGPLHRVARRIEATQGRGMLALYAAAVLVLVTTVGMSPTVKELPPGLGVAEGRFPREELAAAQARCPKGKLFNEFEHGGYIYWQATRPVFIDSRGLLAYSSSFVQSYVAAWASPRAWAELLERHDIAVALVGHRGPGDQRQLSLARWGWRHVYRGPVCSVFVREDRLDGPGEVVARAGGSAR
ncbi:MAG: hypothetical protein ACLF0G_03385 [Candidatus Brocadiia bacterium]